MRHELVAPKRFDGIPQVRPRRVVAHQLGGRVDRQILFVDDLDSIISRQIVECAQEMRVLLLVRDPSPVVYSHRVMAPLHYRGHLVMTMKCRRRCCRVEPSASHFYRRQLDFVTVTQQQTDTSSTVRILIVQAVSDVPALCFHPDEQGILVWCKIGQSGCRGQIRDLAIRPDERLAHQAG